MIAMYLKLLETFFFKIFFNKDEYKINSKHFNPIKFAMVMFLWGCFLLLIVLSYKISRVYPRIVQECPAVLTDNPDVKKDDVK